MEDHLQMGRSITTVDPTTKEIMDDMDCEQLGDLGATRSALPSESSKQSKSSILIKELRSKLLAAEFR